MVSIGRVAREEPRVSSALTAQVRGMARPLRGPEDLDPLLDAIGEARYVLLGEASHGTADYYTWRAEISRRLIIEKGFSFIAVEGDWPDCERVNRYVKGRDDAGESAREVLHAFGRWPTWMWANHEVVAWSSGSAGTTTAGRTTKRSASTGSMCTACGSRCTPSWPISAHRPSALQAAWRAFRCFEPHGEDVQEYARAARFVPDSCEDEVVDLLRELRRSIRDHPADDRESRSPPSRTPWCSRTPRPSTGR